ncbi:MULTISPECIES: hypothetical protein [Acinetobacter]|uniref:hypothetical protein n=1 Tax=Acinetobacter TaxID=469 RepID=UPI0002D11E4E|nr:MULTISPECIES: hypothetical protein [Acinetobacter]ENX60811.1 hypothetical protein F885_01919 [Acinetobacter higginsii]MCH7316782.1 hypothetical protein [Acinetobacter higginsii]
MTFIIAIQLQDSIIVATDNRSSTVDYKIHSDQTPKLYAWKNGIIVGSGEMTVISRAVEFFIKLSKSNIKDLPKCLKISMLMRELEAKHFQITTTKIMYSKSTPSGAQLYTIQPNKNDEYRLEKFQVNEIILWFFNPDILHIRTELKTLYANLKPCYYFNNKNEWINYYLEQLKTIFKKQAQIDQMMSASFDIFFQTKDDYLHEYISTPSTVSVNQE